MKATATNKNDESEMTHLTDGVLLTHHHRVNVIPTFRNEHESGPQNDVTDIGEKVIKVRKVD